MENETKVPARTHVHLTLGAIFIPPLAAAAGWCLAVGDVLRGFDSDAQRRWTRFLVALVVVDSLILMGWMWKASNEDEFKELTEKTPPRSRIGIQVGQAGPVVEQVLPELPAEQAGMKSGDVLLEIGGKAVTTRKEVVRALARAEPAAPLKLRLRRDGKDLEIDVVPAAVPQAEQVGLFQVLKQEEPRDLRKALFQFLPALLLGVLAWLAAWWRFGDRGRVWLGVLISLCGAVAVSFAVDRLLQSLLGGPTVGGGLIGAGANTLALLGLTLLVRRIFPGPAAPEPERRPVPGTYFRGVFYLMTGGFRIVSLLLMADFLWFGAGGMDNPMQDVVEHTKLGATGNLLLILSAVIFAPVAEELLFRGTLLPQLLPRLGRVWAVGISSAVFALLHPQYGLYVPVVLLYGVVLGWARVHSGGLAAPILLHMTINGLATSVMLLR